MGDEKFSHNAMNNKLKSGINLTHIYYSFVNQSIGYEKFGFCIKDLHNKIEIQRQF